jgi:hypothetical protein
MSDFENKPGQDDLEKILGEIRDYKRVHAASQKAKTRIANKRKGDGLRIRRFRLLAIAAIMLIIISVAFSFLSTEAPLEPCQIFADDPQIDLLSGTRGAEAANVGDFHDAREAYYFKLYEEVIANTNNIAPSDSSYHLIMLMRGNAWLGQCEAQKAIPLLKEAMKDPIVAERARWFLALAYVGDEQQDMAIPLLKTQASKRYKAKASSMLLEQLGEE